MTQEQRTPDELTAENELICEKLLGWKRTVRGKLSGCQFWNTEPSQIRTLAFTTWEEAGLILEALQAADCIVSISFAGKGGYCAINSVSSDAKPIPLAIRAAALKYIRNRDSWERVCACVGGTGSCDGHCNLGDL